MTTTPRNRRRRPDVLHAAALVTAALETFAEAVDAEPEFTALLEFDNGLKQAYELGASGLARTEAAMLREAWHLIDTEVPVAAGYPVRSWFDAPARPHPRSTAAPLACAAHSIPGPRSGRPGRARRPAGHPELPRAAGRESPGPRRSLCRSRGPMRTPSPSRRPVRGPARLPTAPRPPERPAVLPAPNPGRTS